MRSDQDHSGKAPRRNSSMPLPGMPYGMRADSHQETSKGHKQGIEFIESTPMPRQQAAAGSAYDPWEELGWGVPDTEQPMEAGADIPYDESYPKPFNSAQPDPYDAHTAEYEPYKTYVQNEPYEQPYGMYEQNEPYEDNGNYGDYPQNAPYSDSADSTAGYPPADSYQEQDTYGETRQYQPVGNYQEQDAYADTPIYPSDPNAVVHQEDSAPPSKPKRQHSNIEPWRMAIILSCIAGLLFCGMEIYKIARNVIRSETEFSDYREIYLKENNVDLIHRAEAVALRPAGETYPPTASPVPVVTPTPTPRIDQNDPLIAVMSDGGTDPSQTVIPSGPTPEIRSSLERYPLNPLLVINTAISALQQENEDIVGRLIIHGILNEIVVQRNNTYYLNHNAMGQTSNYSAVFVDENLSFRYPPENILLYGRTSYEGKAFASLKNYITQGFNFAQRYAFLSFNSLYEDARYVIVAIVQANSSSSSPDYFDYQNLTFATDGQMLAFVAQAKSRSVYNFNVPVAGSDRLLTLVTLSDGTDTENLIIVCRMLRDGESDGVIHAQ